MPSSARGRRFVIGLAFLAAFNLGFFTRPLIDAARHPDAFRVLANSSRIRQAGVSGTPRVIVAFDPYCRHCRALYEALSKHVEAGEVQVDWVPVAFMNADSASVGAEMLTAANPSLALSRWFGAELGTSPVLPKGASPAGAKSRVIENTNLVRALAGRDVAPAVFYRDRGGAIQLTIGVPADFERWLSGIAS